MMPRPSYSVYILASAFAVGGLVGCSRTAAPAEAPGPVVQGDRITFPEKSTQRSAISVQQAEPHAAEIHRLSGRVVWNEDATVRIYSPVAGRVQEVLARPGERVEAGAALARIDSPDFGQAQADARKAEADLMLARRTRARVQDLFDHGAVARKDLEAAEDAEAGAEAEQHRAVARLQLYSAAAGDGDGRFTLRTPIAGTIVEKNLNPGQEVRPDQMLANAPQLLAPLCVVSDPTRLRVMIDTPERDLIYLRRGLPVTVSSESLPGKEFPGEVEWIADALDPATHMVSVRATVENPERLLKAEMFVSVAFKSAAIAGAEVPTTAVFLKGDRHFIWIEERPAVYTRHEVGVGPEQDGKILVTSGVVAGQRVVTDGGLLLDELRADAGGE